MHRQQRYRACIVWVAAAIAAVTQIWSQETVPGRSLDALWSAYPGALVRYDDKMLYWRDGTATPLSDDSGGKSFEQQLRQASIADQVLLPYPRGQLKDPPAVNA